MTTCSRRTVLPSAARARKAIATTAVGGRRTIRTGIGTRTGAGRTVNRLITRAAGHLSTRYAFITSYVVFVTELLSILVFITGI